MRKMDLRKISRKNSEKGIAIVFVLGILGLLMVIGLGFAASSMLESKLAGNTTSKESSRHIARSAFERAYFLLKNGVEINKIVSRPASGNGDYDFLWKLNLAEEEREYGNVEPAPAGYYTPGTGSTIPAWQYISIDGKLVGRFAYKVYPVEPGLDPSIHYGKFAEGGAAALPRFGIHEWEINFFNALKTATRSTYTDAKVKSGYDKLVEKSDSVTTYYPYRFPTLAGFLKVLGVEKNIGSKDITNARIDMKTILETRHYLEPESFWMDINGDEKQTKEEFFHRFNLARNDWDDEKFNDVHLLFGINKGENFPADAYKNAKAYTEKLNGTDAGGNPTVAPSGIQWLGNGGADADVQNKSSWEDAIRRRQVAANIIQYCRKGESVTVADVDWTAANIREEAATAANAGGFLAADPSYAGVGKHPLLNEAALKLNILATVQEEDITNGAGTPRYKYTWNYAPELKIGAEAIDIFGLTEAVRKNIRIYLKGKVEFEYATPDPDTPEGDLFMTDAGGVKNYGTFTHDIDFETYHEITQDAWKNGYTLETSFFRDVDPSAIPKAEGSFEKDGDSSAVRKEINKRLKIRNVKLKIEKLVLKHQDKNDVYRSRDFAKLDWEKKTPEDSELLLQPDTQKFFWIGVQAQDPRVNHYKEDWGRIFSGKTSGNILDDTENLEMKDSDEFSADTAVGGTPGKVNKISVPGDVDSEADLSNPAATGENSPTLSTAYIAQKPMRSLWELGTISRAEAFRTINLTSTRPFASGSVRSGNKDHYLFCDSEDDYKLGDGNILDQVKIHVLEDAADKDRTSSYGKVNINTGSHGVLRALFQSLKLAKDGLTANKYFDPVQNNTGESGGDYEEYEESDFCPDGVTSCIACKILAQTPIAKFGYRFMTRSDLLISNDVSSRLRGNKIGNPYNTDVAKEQTIGKTINLMTAHRPAFLYVVTIGETIKEMPAGSAYYVDWNGNGEYNDSDVPSPPTAGAFFTENTSDQFRIYRKLGYIRPVTLKEKRDTPANKYRFFASTAPQPRETVAKTAGIFTPGVDKITGSTRLVTLLEWDGVEHKWKVRSMTYGE